MVPIGSSSDCSAWYWTRASKPPEAIRDTLNGISIFENSYKTIKNFLAWTTSKEFVVRLFYFSFAVLLYNMWLLVDLIVQVSLDIEYQRKPEVTAKRFLNLAWKYLIVPD